MYRKIDGGRTIVVPEDLRSRLIAFYHANPLTGHLGRDATLQLLQDRYFFPHMKIMVQDHINKCIACTQAKSTPPRRFGLIQQAQRGGDLQTLNMDLFGPLPENGEGPRYILVMYDAFSYYPTLSIINTKEATSIFDAFVKDVPLKGRLPSRILMSDNGSDYALRRPFQGERGQKKRCSIESSSPLSFGDEG